MSAVGRYGDYAACEGFFGMLNRERVNRRKYRALDIAIADIFNYTERFQNPRLRRRFAKSDLEFSTFLTVRENGVEPIPAHGDHDVAARLQKFSGRPA